MKEKNMSSEATSNTKKMNDDNGVGFSQIKDDSKTLGMGDSFGNAESMTPESTIVSTPQLYK